MATLSLLKEAAEAKKFDIRIVEKNIQRGLATEEEYKKSLNSLPDDAANADYSSIEDLMNSEK